MRSRWFPFAICMGFALIGLVLLVVGGPQDTRAIGLMSLLFFGGGGLALATPLLSRQGPGTVRLTTVDDERGLLLPTARRKQALQIVAAAGMAAACVVISAAGASIWAAIAGGGFFGLVALVLAATSRGHRGLALTPTRVKLLGWGDPELDWEAILHASLYWEGRTQMLGIAAKEPGAVRRRRGRRTARLSRKLSAFDIIVAVEQLSGTPEHALDTLETYLDDPARRARLGTPEELTYLGLADGDGLR